MRSNIFRADVHRNKGVRLFSRPRMHEIVCLVFHLEARIFFQGIRLLALSLQLGSRPPALRQVIMLHAAPLPDHFKKLLLRCPLIRSCRSAFPSLSAVRTCPRLATLFANPCPWPWLPSTVAVAGEPLVLVL